MTAIIEREMSYSELAEQERLLAAAESMEAQAHELYAQAHDVEANSDPVWTTHAATERKFAIHGRERAARHFAQYQTYLAKAEKEGRK